MTKVESYRAILRALDEWEPYLLRESGLPGPRGNLELIQAVADEASREQIERLLTWDASRAPPNDPHEFLAACGTVGLGRLLVEGDRAALTRLRRLASDTRWRTREAVAMALQRWGDADMDKLLAAMERWARGKAYEQRAAAAALCEPRLLRDPQHARKTLAILHAITASLADRRDRKGDDVIALIKGLSYCWSVAVAALPAEGKRAMNKWMKSRDKDIRKIMQENLKKNRLVRMDAA